VVGEGGAGLPSAAQIRTVVFSPTVVNHDPPGATATAVTGMPWPLRILTINSSD
jgi:hypothetical protein